MLILSTFIIEADQGYGCLVTPLYQTTQPLLRYELGDELEWQPTPRSMCPIKLPVITVKAGRRDDWLFDQNDMKVAPLALYLEQFDFIGQWSIVQESGGEIILCASWRTPPTEPEISAVLQEMQPLSEAAKCELQITPATSRVENLSACAVNTLRGGGMPAGAS
jgi:hypothetical protein